MQVTITHSSKIEGMMRKVEYFDVSISVRFSDDERTTISRHGLGGALVLEREPPANLRSRVQEAGLWNLTIAKLSSDTYSCATPLEAKNYDAQLRDTLPKVRAYIDANVTPLSGSDTFDPATTPRSRSLLSASGRLPRR